MCIHMDQKEKVRDVVLMLQCSKKPTTATHALRFVVALATYIHTCLYRNWTSWWIPRIDYIRRHERRFCCGAALVVPIHLKLIKNTEAKFKDEGRRRESPVVHIIHFPYVFHSSHLYVTYCFVSNIVYYLKMRGHSNEVASSQTTCRGLDARYYYKTSIASATTRHLLSMLRLTLLRSMEFQFYCGQ